MFNAQILSHLAKLKERCGEAVGTLFSEESRRAYDEKLKTKPSPEQELQENSLRTQFHLFKTLYQQAMQINELQMKLSHTRPNEMMAEQPFGSEFNQQQRFF